MKNLIILLCCLFSLGLNAQDYNPNRYRESIFPTVLTVADVVYGAAPQWVFPYWEIDLKLDVYEPDGDLNPKRPVIIFAHAGGFINGSKEVDNMVAICDSFAQKGYVTASIDYRKGFDPLDSESAERAAYRALQDGKAAVRYFKENAGVYNIDTNNVFFGGMSAGGFIALNVAYMDKESERPASTYGGGLVNDLECLDCAGNDFAHTSEVRAILDFWGGVNDTLILEEGNIPLLIMHGENDPVVPYEFGHPFGLFTLPESYGGLPISERATNMGVPFEKFTSTGELHMLDGSDNGTFVEVPNSFWSDTLLPESERFLYELLKPNTIRISADSTVLCSGDSLVLQVSDSLFSHYLWGYDSDLVSLVFDDNSGEIELVFNEAGVHSITVVEFNEVLCAGDTIHFIVEVMEEINPGFEAAIVDFNLVNYTNLTAGASTYFWDFGDGETSSDESPNHTYIENGTYDVMLIATNEFGCSDTIIQSVVIEGLEVGDEFLNPISVFPNPFNDLIEVVNKDELLEVVKVTAVNGQVVFYQSQINASTLSIETSNWLNGVYFVQIQTDGGVMDMVKVVK